MSIEQRQRVLAIVAIGAVALMAADKLVISPLTALWKDHAARIVALTKSIEQGTGLLDRERTIRQRWTGMATNTLPANSSVAESKVFNAVDRWTKDSGITFSSLKPQWKQNADDYLTLECRADALGDIHSVTRFLYDLESEHILRGKVAGPAPAGGRGGDALALRLEDLDISAKDNNGQQLSLGVRFTGLVLTGEQP